ncbi:hypothetical protein ACQKM9_17465 [Viridibacillus sp. NPDC093762]|uniref:hypothetical protein n=1 Tax=Viridibacillus sp. NPDC093762 TaxID=3390720 RepID=UPI003CFCFDE2
MKKIYIIIVLLISITSMFIIVNKNLVSDKKLVSYESLENKEYHDKTFNSLPDKEITILEAYRIGLGIANKYDKESELIFLNSVDDELASGYDGKKGNWQGIISLLNRDRRLLFVIEKGKLKSYFIIEGTNEQTIKDSYLKIDSSQIVKQASKDFKLEPGKESQFSSGYHFRIIRDEKNIFLSVDGEIDGKPAEIYYNPKNGKYMGHTSAND